MKNKKTSTTKLCTNLPHFSNKMLKIFNVSLITFNLLISCKSERSPNPCDCVPLLQEKPNNSTWGNFTDDEYKLWKRCYEEYAGPSGATLECIKKNDAIK